MQLVSGLGSIVVRTLFQPFEEAAFVAFSKEQGELQLVGKSGRTDDVHGPCL